MKPYIENGRLTLEAEEGMKLTDGEELYVNKISFAIGVKDFSHISEISLEECERRQTEADELVLE